MLAVPIMTEADVAFGSIKHMPKWETVPKEFQDWHHNPYCESISAWFYRGCKASPNSLLIDGVKYTAKPEVDGALALNAIRAVMVSWAPKHEHKIAACGYMLSEWFNRAPSTTE